MDPSKDLKCSNDISNKKDLSIDPAIDCGKEGDNIWYFENPYYNKEGLNLVVGDSSIDDIWKARSQEKVSSTPMDWLIIEEATCEDLAAKIIKTLRVSKIPLRISAIIWHTSIEKYSLEALKSCVKDIVKEMKANPHHKIIFPTCNFIPAQKKFWDKVADFNTFLDDVNLKNGFNTFHLHKIIMSKNRGELKVRQGAWVEFNTEIGVGNQLDKKEHSRYAQAIANFHHKGGFRDDGRDQASSSRAPVRAPFQQIQHPKEVDLRKFTLDAKSLKRTLFIQNKRKDSNDDLGEVSKENKKIRLDKTEEDLNQKELDLKAREHDLNLQEAEYSLKDKEMGKKLKKMKAKETEINLKKQKFELEEFIMKGEIELLEEKRKRLRDVVKNTESAVDKKKKKAKKTHVEKKVDSEKEKRKK